MKLPRCLLLLLLGMFSLSVAEVVDSFKETCPQFFIKNNNNKAITPTVFNANQYKQICQFYKGEYRFATLYDTYHRIPVYSAFTYSTTEHRQIHNIPNQADTCTNKQDSSLNIKYTRGHVFPKSYAQGTQQKESTFTLTNAAPQTEESNRKWAKHVEEPMLEEIKGNCDNKSLVYIVTGVVPGETWLPIKRGVKIEKGVNIPRYFWTAFSCKPKKNKIDSHAYIAELFLCTVFTFLFCVSNDTRHKTHNTNMQINSLKYIFCNQ
uniref:Uncharacterized protein n=1 Tax=Astyanax mexicanus TaxID=7994 RepID=A0A3B1JDZ6_ASTMX